MDNTKKARASLNSAEQSFRQAARKRRFAAYKYWKTQKTYAEVGAKFGVSRQRAAVMVRTAREEMR